MSRPEITRVKRAHVLLVYHRRRTNGHEPRSFRDIARRLGYRHTPAACELEYLRLDGKREAIEAEFAKGKTPLQVIRDLWRGRSPIAAQIGVEQAAGKGG